MTLQATKLRESVEWATHDDLAAADPKLGNLTLPLFLPLSLCLRVSVRAKSGTRTARRNGAGRTGRANGAVVKRNTTRARPAKLVAKGTRRNSAQRRSA